jgi:phage FluMu gp28-like protein
MTQAQNKATDGRTPAQGIDPLLERLSALSRDYFMAFQVKWIRDDSQLKLYPKSRRIGVTYATSFRAVIKCMRFDGLVQWVSSKDLDLAREFVAVYVRKWCELANIVASGLGCEDVVDLGQDERGQAVTAFQVRFPNGSRIVSLSSNPRKFAGKGGDILIDEMDLHQDQAPLYDMALPCIDWGGQLEIVSAYDPEGSTETVFAKLVEEAKHGNPKGWSLHETTILDAVAQGIVEKVNAEAAKRGRKAVTREQFVESKYKRCRTIDSRNSQYLCIPVNAANLMAVRPQDLAHAKQDYRCEYRRIEGNARAGDRVDASVAEIYNGGIWLALREAFPLARWTFGLDIARTGDLTSLWIDAWLGEMATCAAVINLHGCKFESQEQFARCAIRELRATGRGDATGLGMQLCENLQRDYPGQFEGVNFSAAKRDLGTRLVEAFEAGFQVVPREPLCIAADIACIRKTTSQDAKKLVFDEGENEHEPDSHADMAWACALSKLAAALAAGPAEWCGLPAVDGGGDDLSSGSGGRPGMPCLELAAGGARFI